MICGKGSRPAAVRCSAYDWLYNDYDDWSWLFIEDTISIVVKS